MAAGGTPAIAVLHFGFSVQDLKCVQLICTQMPALQVPFVMNTVLPLLAAALLLCCHYLDAELPATACCHEKKREKTAPFGVNLMRSQVLYQAAQVLAAMPGAYSAVWPHLAGLSNCSLAAAAAAYTPSLLLALL